MKRKVEICGVDTSALPKLSSAQSRELLQQIRNGNANARNEFINCNLRLVLSIVQRYVSRSKNLDDLFQIGCVGLIKSVDNFNPDFGVCFSTYAVPMIDGEIRRFLRESNSLRVSRGVRDVAYRALQTRDKLENETSRDVTVNDVAEELHLPVFKVIYCLDAISDPVSLSDAVYSDEEDSLSLQDHIADESCSENMWADNVTLCEAMRNLEPKEQSVLEKRYFEGKTQMEVSREVGLSQAQISRLEKSAVEKLREDFC